MSFCYEHYTAVRGSETCVQSSNGARIAGLSSKISKYFRAWGGVWGGGGGEKILNPESGRTSNILARRRQPTNYSATKYTPSPTQCTPSSAMTPRTEMNLHKLRNWCHNFVSFHRRFRLFFFPLFTLQCGYCRSLEVVWYICRSRVYHTETTEVLCTV